MQYLRLLLVGRHWSGVDRLAHAARRMLGQVFVIAGLVETGVAHGVAGVYDERLAQHTRGASAASPLG